MHNVEQRLAAQGFVCLHLKLDDVVTSGATLKAPGKLIRDAWSENPLELIALVVGKTANDAEGTQESIYGLTCTQIVYPAYV